MDALLTDAIAAARLARGIHLYYQEKGFAVDTKSGPTDLVTQADKETEIAIKTFCWPVTRITPFWAKKAARKTRPSTAGSSTR